MTIETQSADQQNESPKLEDLLQEIKREDGSQKYTSVEEALKGAAHGQTTIQTLLSEARDKDTQLDENLKIMETMADRISKLEEATASISQIKKEDPLPEPQSPVETPQVKPEADIEALVQQAINKQNEQASRQQNLNKVMATLTERHGEDVSNVLQKGAEKYGFTSDQVSDLAATKPEAFLQLFDVKKEGTPVLRQTSLRTPVEVQETEKPSFSLSSPRMTDNVEVVKAAREAAMKKLGYI